jgi:hypothetical protein
MSKSFKYVKEFVFPSEAGYSGSAGKTTVKGYYRGGDVADTKKVMRNEREELNRVETKRKNAGQEIKRVKSEMRYDKAELKPMKKMAGGMIKDTGKLGIVNNKNPGETKNHTAPKLPGKTMMKNGGKVPMKKFSGGAISDKDYQLLQEAASGAAGAGAAAGAKAAAKKIGSRADRGVGALTDADIKYVRDAMRKLKAEEARESASSVNRAKGGYMHGGMHQKKK